jgi:hypothetical protein
MYWYKPGTVLLRQTVIPVTSVRKSQLQLVAVGHRLNDDSLVVFGFRSGHTSKQNDSQHNGTAPGYRYGDDHFFDKGAFGPCAFDSLCIFSFELET